MVLEKITDAIKNFFPKKLKELDEEELRELLRKKSLTEEEFYRIKRDRAIKEYNDICDLKEIKKKDRH